MDANQIALVAVQMDMYPDSMILDGAFVLSWAGTNYRRLQAVASTITCPGGIWYWIPRVGESAVTGYRYGTAPEQYISGFSDL
jgi:hypothetical protein